MARKQRKERPVNYDLLPKSHEAYTLMETILARHHQALKGANIALVWQHRVKPDRDQKLTLGKCRKASDLNKEFAEFDFVIILNYDAWHRFNDKQREALLDHELCHAAPDTDSRSGEQKKDDRGRLLWRVRKHDVEEFTEIIDRHGLYKRDLEDFILAGAKKLPPGLFDGPCKTRKQEAIVEKERRHLAAER